MRSRRRILLPNIAGGTEHSSSAAPGARLSRRHGGGGRRRRGRISGAGRLITLKTSCYVHPSTLLATTPGRDRAAAPHTYAHAARTTGRRRGVAAREGEGVGSISPRTRGEGRRRLDSDPDEVSEYLTAPTGDHDSQPRPASGLGRGSPPRGVQGRWPVAAARAAYLHPPCPACSRPQASATGARAPSLSTVDEFEMPLMRSSTKPPNCHHRRPFILLHREVGG